VLVRENTFVPVCSFDGKQIPEPNASYDVVMFVDVLHHTKDPMVLLREACRVTRHTILIKDHNANGAFSYPLLRLMDRVGNSRYGVALPYNYWPEQRWREAFLSLRLTTDTWDKRIGLYPWPASLVFDRNPHFLTQQHKFNES
jgi:SAM-dependent methyltransferase